ncbi:MAG TPA: adenosylcobalamin-dependent ribonucleoside-diphosphate reductase [Acidimicrobiia bacterium]|nr:adenosylcobalamin-dependent ribonucleoside-diphosphate reductase [Acidimicrobiia bacterium]
MSKGLRIDRRFTEAGKDAYDKIEWSRRDSRITNPDGSIVFEMTDAEIPSGWSQVAADIMVSKYFRKAGVPQFDDEGNQIFDEAGQPVMGPERSAKQVFNRLAGTWRHWGEKEGYFASTEDAAAFEDELRYMLANQMAAPNSPQWFNTGLNWAYGLTGPAQGFWYVDGTDGEMKASPDSYSRPSPHACFPAGTRVITDEGFKAIEKIQPGDQVLTHEGRFRPVREVMQRQVDEDIVRLTIGNQTVTATENHPVLVVRDGQHRWLAIGDLMLGEQVFTMPNPESALPHGIAAPVLQIDRVPFFGTVYNFQVEEDESYVANGVVVHNCFILSVKDDLVNPGGIMDLWVREARIFKFGSGAGSNFSMIRGENERLSGGGKSSGVMSFLKIGDRAAGAIKSGGTTRRAAKMVILDVDHPDIEKFIDWKKVEEDKARVLINHGGLPADFNGDAYATVSGQNSNNSVRVTNEFIQTVLDDGDWNLYNRTDGSVRKTVKARDLWNRIAEAAWACADPGLQFDTTINEWHTSPAGGRIRASNPCSEYLFLDDTACNLASINLVRFYDDETGVFDIKAYQHAIRLWTVVLEISVAMAHFPSREIAQGSYDYRTLGLGYANLGSLLMRQGIAYDSDQGRAIAGAMTAILTGFSYATSAEIAEVTGPFPKFSENRESMLRVIRNHRRAAYGHDDYEGVTTQVMAIDPSLCPPDMLEAARASWDLALERGELHGFRNAQSSVIAPTGTIGLLLDSDTTGIEPDFSLVKFKKLAGGGYFKIVNQSVTPALAHLGYDAAQIKDVVEYIVGTSSLDGAPHINRETLAAKGFDDEDLDKLEKALLSVFELRQAFNVFTFGEATLQRLGFGVDEYTGWEFNLLKALGFTQSDINEANDHICGRQTIEGAPRIKDEHLVVFDTANKNGKYGTRFIHHYGHIKMMAAAQPFISGAISKTINMPNEITVEDIEEAYRMSWELGLKAMAIYRDGSKAAQPLNSTSDEGEGHEDETAGITAAVEAEKAIHWGNLPPGISPTQAYKQGMKPPRFLLPARRNGYNQEARIGGHKVFLRTGEYEDHTLGEIFIDLAKEGATLKGILSCFAIAVSKGLQYGVPLEEFVDTFTFQTFEPRGMVEGHPNIKMANSIVDYVFRALGVEYLQRDELAQVPPNRDVGELPEPAKGLAVEAGVQLDLTDAVAETDVDAVKAAVAFVDSPESRPSPDVPLPGVAPLPSGETGSSVVPLRSGGTDASERSERVEGGLAVQVTEKVVAAGSAAAVDSALKENMGDAPVCSNCGHMTIRNGSCYVCLTCGDTTGCS